MKAKYLGLDLSSPVVVSSSPYTATVSNIEQCVRNGAGAVVLKSIFEEQIYRQAASLDRMEGYGDAGEYNAVHACGSVLAAIHTLPAGSCRAVGTTNLHEYMCSR